MIIEIKSFLLFEGSKEIYVAVETKFEVKEEKTSVVIPISLAICVELQVLSKKYDVPFYYKNNL